MKKDLIFILAAFSAASASAESQPYPSAWSLYDYVRPADRTLLFDYNAEGKKLPILWGFDTAWNDYANMLRGVRHAGSETVGVARVSFQPWAEISEKGVLPPLLQENLDKRLETVALIGRKVDIALNLDGGEPTVKEIYGGLDPSNNYIGDKDAVADAYARLIDATAAAVEKAGYRVVSAAPFNEPDYFWNGTPIDVFAKINSRLKDFDEYPRFRDIRISGGNTLNCDEALPWYNELKDNLDEGNTHQLAGDFNHYADFFTTVRADGKYATADELHNVMEAMVGVEYGMQTGIWWGSAEQARGEFMKASGGERLGYAENRKAWSAASVYRAPSGKVQAFLGCSERQALPSTYNIVSRKGDFYVDGYGPVREYLASLPGDPAGGYQTELQRNAETVLSITRGEDIQPFISGDYALINCASKMAVSGRGGSTSNGTDIVQRTYSGAKDQIWTVRRVPETQGGDFSYHFITNTGTSQALDDNNWNLETGGKVIAYGASGAAVQQWAFEYDGDGWFHIRNKQSALYLECDGPEGTMVLQQERNDSPVQKWRFLPSGASLEFEAPSAPSGLRCSPSSAGVLLEWEAVADAGTVTYAVLRSEADSDDYNTIAMGLETSGFFDNTVVGEIVYRYKVRAEDESGNRSECSREVECGAVGKAMIAWYPMDGTIEDNESNGFTLRTLVEPSYRTGHKDGVSSLFFRGTQYAQLPYSILQGDAFSISFWARTGSASEGKQLFSTGVSADETFYLSPSEGGLMRLVAINSGNSREITAPASTEWTHVAVSADNGIVSLYVNGELVGTDDFSDVLPADRVLSYIGRGHEATSSYLVGYMDDLRIYNYAVSAETVKEAMSGEYSGISGVDMAAPGILRVEYYSPQGVRLTSPAERGVTIVRTVYTDGTVRTVRQMK